VCVKISPRRKCILNLKASTRRVKTIQASTNRLVFDLQIDIYIFYWIAASINQERERFERLQSSWTIESRVQLNALALHGTE